MQTGLQHKQDNQRFHNVLPIKEISVELLIEY